MSPGLRILYAEDDALDADLTRAHFAEHAPEFVIEIVGTGQACLDRFRSAHYDLLLLDNRLPDMDGVDILRTLVRTGVSVPVVLVTGSGDEDLVVKALRLGASNYVPKLGNYLTSLPDLLRSVIEEHRLKLEQGLLAVEPRRILYVEHQEIDIDLTQRHFAEAAPALELDVARTCADALERLGQPSAYDAALIDLRMPDQSGLDFVRETKRRGLALPPFIMISGKGDEGAAIASLKLGAADYIAKRDGYLDQLPHVIERAIAHDRLNGVNAQLERRVRERTAQLKASNEALEAFAYSVSHDLRAPLRHLDGFLSLLRSEAYQNATPNVRDYIDKALAASRRMDALIESLLQFSRLGRVELNRVPVDLKAIVDETIRELQPSAEGRIVRFHIDDLPPLTADPIMMRQIMQNLLGNALKFTRPRAEAKIAIRAGRTSDGSMTISVQDNGVGFDNRYSDKLFQMFQRLHREDEFEGIGIGLAHVRRMVERHGGRIWAEGTPGSGATFCFCLPQMDCVPEHRERPALHEHRQSR